MLSLFCIYKKVERHMTSRTCDICYELKIEFKECSTCHNGICTQCQNRVQKCPFCRTFYNPDQRRPDFFEQYVQFEQWFLSYNLLMQQNNLYTIREYRRNFLNSRTMFELKSLCRTRLYTRYSHLRKADLIGFILSKEGY